MLFDGCRAAIRNTLWVCCEFFKKNVLGTLRSHDWVHFERNLKEPLTNRLHFLMGALQGKL